MNQSLFITYEILNRDKFVMPYIYIYIYTLVTVKYELKSGFPVLRLLLLTYVHAYIYIYFINNQVESLVMIKMNISIGIHFTKFGVRIHLLVLWVSSCYR